MKLKLFLTSIVLVFFVFPVVRAEKALEQTSKLKERESTTMEEIIVTATKTEEKLHNIPASVTVLQGEDLLRSGVRVVGDALQWIPGIHLADVSGNGTQFWGSMRGMPAHNNRYYLVLLNGIPRNNSSDEFWWFTMPIERVEKIEIIKGAFSALYGRSAMGGVINIITKKGAPQREASLSGYYGSYGENRQSGLLSGNLKNFSYSFGVVRYASDGWREVNDEFEQLNVFGDFDYNITNTIHLALDVDFTHTNRDMPGGVPIQDYLNGKRKLVHFDDVTTYHDEPNVGLTLDVHPAESIKLTNRLYIQHVKENWNNMWIVNNKDDKGLRIGDEIQFQYDHFLFDLKNQIIAGYQFENQGLAIVRRYGSHHWIPSLIGKLYLDADTLRRFNAVYIQDTFSIIPEQLTFIAGLRYDHVHVKYDDVVESLSVEKDMDQLSPKAGIIFSPLKELNVFANVSTGFRAPIASNFGQNPDLEPEKTVNYELGIRGWLWERLRYQIVGYYSEIDDMLCYILAKPRNIIDNAAEANAKGVELELETFLPYGFSTFFNYNYNYTKLEKFVDWAGNDWSGKTPPFQPRNKIAGGLRYENPKGLKGMITIRWFDDQWITEANDIKLKSYALVDLNLSYRFRENIELSLSVRNLFDKDYTCYGEDLGWGEVYLTPGDPRTFLVGVTWRF